MRPSERRPTRSPARRAGLARAVTLLLAFAVGVPAAVAQPDRPQVTIAIRKDAAPFTFVEGQGRKRYGGFLWSICLDAIQRAGYDEVVIEVDAEQRREFLATGTLGPASVDLLCDPTTITLSRMENFDDLEGNAPGLEYSPIVFIANGSYVQQPFPHPLSSGRERTGPVDAFCDSLTDRQAPEPERPAPRRWWVPKLFPDARPEPARGTPFEVWGYVEGSTIGDAVEQAITRVGDDRVICTFVQVSHAKAAERFCEGRLHRYFGDVELVKAALADHERATGEACPADLSQTRRGTYEPYALVVSGANRSEFPERFTREIYAMFHDGKMDDLFRKHFQDAPKSEYLDILFRINSIPVGGD